MRGSLAELAEWAADGVLGEITVVLAGAEPQADLATLVAEVTALVEDGMRVKDACAQVIAANPGRAVAARALRCGSALARLSRGRHGTARAWCSCTAVSTPATAGSRPSTKSTGRHRNSPCSPSTCPAAAASPATSSTATIADWVDSVVSRYRGRGHRRDRHRRPFDGGAHRSGCGDETRIVAGAGDGARRGLRSTGGSAVVDTLPGVFGRYARRYMQTRADVGHIAEHVGDVRILQRDDPRATQVQPERFYAESPPIVVEKVDRAGHARRRAAHLDPDAARPRAIGDISNADPSPRSAACRPSSRWTRATT